ncbi:unnamed protein product [Didymodactylos carnosus]|uniref:Sodefrin-like factor n=1 Tax=Didymodactylos carnosus TaxID=1234261 RepID=A0A813SWG4_9BILA|nr:unnamed protein product [Didymodactylos carnosus]CAF3585749.1 unnamed protein product [Didymodactylos carnosus]
MFFYLPSAVFLAAAVFPANGRECYTCACPANSLNCPCSTTDVQETDITYCIINRDHKNQGYSTYLGFLPRNSSKYSIKNPHYISIREVIHYNDSAKEWDTNPDGIIYGCDWDRCNSPDLVPKLPNSFSLALPESWLSNFILGSNPGSCHECSDDPNCGTDDFLDVGRCPEKACNDTCVLREYFENPDSGEFCYQSSCFTEASSPAYDLDTHRIEIDAIYYLDSKIFNVWEIDIFCRADDCSRPEIFKEIRANLEKNVTIDGFESVSSTIASTASTPASTASMPASTASATGSTIASIASTPALTASATVSTIASTPASTASATVSTIASTPASTASTPASTASATVSTNASTASTIALTYGYLSVFIVFLFNFFR